MTCKHCQQALARCLCLEEGRISAWTAAVRLLFTPEAYGPEMEDAVAQVLGGGDDDSPYR